MKTKTFVLTAKFKIDPQGESSDTLKRQITSAMNRAIGDGLITGSTAATVEDYEFEVVEKKEQRKSGEHLFNVDMGVCVTCGESAEDELIAPTKCLFKRKK
jgi:hypothetical protein